LSFRGPSLPSSPLGAVIGPSARLGQDRIGAWEVGADKEVKISEKSSGREAIASEARLWMYLSRGFSAGCRMKSNKYRRERVGAKGTSSRN
jgi:hypothetical protein